MTCVWCEEEGQDLRSALDQTRYRKSTLEGGSTWQLEVPIWHSLTSVQAPETFAYPDGQAAVATERSAARNNARDMVVEMKAGGRLPLSTGQIRRSGAVRDGERFW